MQLVDEIFKSFKEYHSLDDLKKMNSRAERFEKIREIVAGVNVFKAEIQDLTLDEQLYLSCKIQQKRRRPGLMSVFPYFLFQQKLKVSQTVQERQHPRLL